MDYMIRRARTPDVRAIADLVSINVESRRLLGKATVTLYEDVQEFWVAERPADGEVVGCGALHVMWEDLAEIRTVAVRPGLQRHGIGHRLVAALLGSARGMGMNSPDMIVVSGAGTGIGRAVSRRLVADGFHVLAVGRRPEPLERLAKELAPHLDTVSADLATVAGATAVAESVGAAERRCAGVVAAAGGVSPGGEGTTGLDGVRQDWLASFESNVLTAVLLVEALWKALERDGGRVVLLSSVAALRGSGGGAYGAVKAALHG